MRKCIIALLSDTDILPVKEEPVENFNPDTSVESRLVEAEEATSEASEVNDSVQEGVSVTEEVEKISEVVKVAQESGFPLRPQTVAILNVAIESLKKRIDYTGDKAILSMENFGGKMTMSAATSLALEDFASLVSEVEVAIAKNHVEEYSHLIISTNKLNQARALIAQKAIDIKAKCLDFYKSDKYKVEFASTDLVSKSYIKHIFSIKESADNKMPTTAVLNAINQFKTDLSTTRYLSSIQELKGALEAVLGNEGWSKEDCKAQVVSVYSILNKLVTGINYTDGYSKFTTVDYPLGGKQLKCESYNNYSVNEFKTFWSNTSVVNQITSDDIKLGALSAQEAEFVNGAVNELALSSESFYTEAGCVLDQLVLLGKKRDDVAESIRLKDEKEANEFMDVGYVLMAMVRGIVTFTNVIAKNEVTILNALNNYCEDSVSTLAQKTAVADPAQPAAV